MSDFMITRRGGGAGGDKGSPVFTYTGSYKLVDDLGGTIRQGDPSISTWELHLLTSGTLTFSKLGSAKDNIDAFLVGGGGGSSWSMSTGAAYAYRGNSGSYTILTGQIEVDSDYTIQIGAGGGVNSIGGLAGGTTSAFSNTAAGGASNEETMHAYQAGIYAFNEEAGSIRYTGNMQNAGSAGTPNTGKGGCNDYNITGLSSGRSGGSGIVIIRNHRGA